MRALEHMHASARMHIYNKVYAKNRHAKIFTNVKYLPKKATFLRKDLVERKIVSTFALAFEKYAFS